MVKLKSVQEATPQTAKKENKTIINAFKMLFSLSPAKREINTERNRKFRSDSTVCHSKRPYPPTEDDRTTVIENSDGHLCTMVKVKSAYEPSGPPGRSLSRFP